MRKLFIFTFVLFLCSCAAPMQYDHTKFSVSPDVKLLAIDANSTVRARDGQMSVQVSGMSEKNQSVYYKTEWFDINGMRISTSLSQWKKVNLHKNIEFVWNATAPSKRATSYKVYITDDIGKGIID